MSVAQPHEIARESIRRRAFTIAKGSLGAFTIGALAVAGIAPILTGGLSAATLGVVLSQLGGNALADWVAGWAERATDETLREGQPQTEELLARMSADLQQQLETNSALAADVDTLLTRSEAISTALHALQGDSLLQLAWLRQLRADLKTSSLRNVQRHTQTIQTIIEQSQSLRRLMETQQAQLLAEIRQTARASNAQPATSAWGLRRHIQQRDAYITDKTEGFIGRTSLFAVLDRFLSARPSGYFVVRGEPGIGKTAFIAELVRRRGYPHHFNVATERISTPADFYPNLTAQLIEAWQLPYGDLPAETGRDNTIFSRILAEAAGSDRRVVLAVDALDEAARPDAAGFSNPLGLPRSLPQGAYIVVSTRPIHPVLEIDAEQVDSFEIAAQSVENERDVKAYIEAFARREPLAGRLAGAAIAVEQFVERLWERSEGNFMYLRHVLPEIAAGRFLRGDANDLPQGLRGYYRRHWEQMRGASASVWEEKTQIMEVLAAERRPVSSQQIAKVTGMGRQQVLQTLEQWRPFLREQRDAAGVRYHIYHASYLDFLEAELGR